MSLHLITGYAGQEHITAADHASFNVSVFGKDNFVFERGNRFKAETISNNLIRILDGDLMIQGRHVRLAENTYEELQIENGTQGMYRYDCIVARYTKDAATGIEKCEFVVVKGEENATAGKEPELTKGDITEQGNDLVTDYLLYRVELEGINIVTVRKMFRTKNLLQNAIVPTYKKIILNTKGWHRIAQIKFDNANKANGSLGNNCEIEINRPYMNGRNEFHKIQLASLYTKSVFQNERSSGIDAFYITKIRHVVDTNTNTTYLEIYYNASSENQPIVTLSNHMNFDNMFWELIEPELTSETVDGVTVLGSHDFVLNYSAENLLNKGEAKLTNVTLNDMLKIVAVGQGTEYLGNIGFGKFTNYNYSSPDTYMQESIYPSLTNDSITLCIINNAGMTRALGIVYKLNNNNGTYIRFGYNNPLAQYKRSDGASWTEVTIS